MKTFSQFLSENEWIDVPGPKYDRLPSLNKGERWSYSGVENHPINKMKTIQHQVTRVGVAMYSNGKEKPARVHVGHDDTVYVQDGHHQYTSAVKTKKSHIPAETWRIVKNEDI